MYKFLVNSIVICISIPRKWTVAATQPSSIRLLRWQPPASGWIKCNFDAAWDENGSIGGFGLLFRDGEGGFLAAQVGREAGVRSALHAEAAAARAAALFLRRWSMEQVQVEGDALLVTSAIQNAGAAYSGHYGHLFEDTRKLLKEFRQWKITFG
ncbi:uncharacterized protein [Pyrus communis]|uniref:uncharacterized protein n=1 Tax=Pyrus communis TaxID=23211 RepID=UPI0035C25671